MLQLKSDSIIDNDNPIQLKNVKHILNKAKLIQYLYQQIVGYFFDEAKPVWSLKVFEVS